MELYAYRMGEQAEAWADDGESDGFTLNTYFTATKTNPASRDTGPGAYVFAAPARVSEFLQMLRGKLAEQMRSEEHTSELQSLMRISYAVLCLKKHKQKP